MPLDFAALRTEFTTLTAEAETLVNTVAAAKRDFTDEEKTQKDQKFKRLEQIKQLLEDEAKLAGLQFAHGKVTTGTLPPGKAAVDGERDGAVTIDKVDKAEFSKAVSGWAGTGHMDPKFATITTASQSGVYLPKEVAAPIIPTAANTFRDAITIQGMDTVSIVTTPTTGDLSVPVVTGAAGGKVAENASSETDGTPTLTESISLTVSTYQSGSVYYSNQLLAAGTVDIVGGVVPVLGYEKELGLESQIVTTIKADSNITQAVTLASANVAGITFAKLQAFNRLLPKRFDFKKVILVGDDTYSAMEALVDSQGRPLLAQDTQNQELKRFLGTPVLRCSYFDAIAAAKVIGAVVSLLGFRLRDVDGSTLARYDQVPAKPNQTGFNLFSYHGYGYAPSAVGLLKTP